MSMFSITAEQKLEIQRVKSRQVVSKFFKKVPINFDQFWRERALKNLFSFIICFVGNTGSSRHVTDGRGRREKIKKLFIY